MMAHRTLFDQLWSESCQSPSNGGWQDLFMHQLIRFLAADVISRFSQLGYQVPCAFKQAGVVRGAVVTEQGLPQPVVAVCAHISCQAVDVERPCCCEQSGLW